MRIAGRWFPRALLVDVNVGHLNLAEAVLDMTGGEPQPTSVLLKDVELPAGVNPKLAEFSLNFALQEDERFDEVGPAGQVLWCLRRLSRKVSGKFRSTSNTTPSSTTVGLLTDQMLALESQLDDELSPIQPRETDKTPPSLLVSLIFPHLREGTLPLSPCQVVVSDSLRITACSVYPGGRQERPENARLGRKAGRLCLWPAGLVQ